MPRHGLNVKQRRALGARVAAYVCTESRPPVLAKLRGPLDGGKLPTSVRLTEACPRCGQAHAVELLEWRLPRDRADLAGARLDVEHDAVAIAESRRREPAQPKRATARQAVIEALREHGPLTRSELEKATGRPASTLTKALTHACGDGTLTYDGVGGQLYDGVGGQFDPRRYRLADGR